MLQIYVNPEPHDQDHFGRELWADLEYVLIGAPEAARGKIRPGAAYLFKAYNESEPAMPLTCSKFVAEFKLENPTNKAHFGESLLKIGERVFVGAPGEKENGGAVYIFGLDGAPKGKIENPSAKPGDGFGWATCAIGNKILIGAPDAAGKAGRAYLFDAIKHRPELVKTLCAKDAHDGDRFGYGVGALGNQPIVGAPVAVVSGIKNAGKVYLFPAE